MKLGLFLSAQYSPDDPLDERLEELKHQIQAAEEYDFATVVLGHHYLARSAFLQPIPLAGYLAGVTKRISIAFGVMLLPLLNPLALAEDIATLDALSRGRMIVGFGAGYRKIEFEAFGVPYDDRFRILEQYVPLMRSLWSGEQVTASGVFGTLKNARIEIEMTSKGGPPIWLGAFGDIGIKRAARLDASWLAGPEGDDDMLAQRLELFRGELTRHGHSLERDYPLTRECCVAPTREQALASARPFLKDQYDGYRNWEQARQLDFDDFLVSHCLVGTPDDVLSRLRSFHDHLGVTQVVLRVQWMGMPSEDVMTTIRTLGEHVLPEIRSWK